jgi:hypothetical protein
MAKSTIKAVKKIPNSLEEYAPLIGVWIESLVTINNLHVNAERAGIMPEHMMQNCSVIKEHLKNLMKLHADQLFYALELLPKEFTGSEALAKLIKKGRKE